MTDESRSNALRVSASVKMTQTGDGAMLLDIKQGLCFSLNTVGMLICKKIGEGSSIDQICRDLAETFAVPLDQTIADVDEFLKELKQKRLLTEPYGTEPSAQALDPFRLRLANLRKRIFGRSH